MNTILLLTLVLLLALAVILLQHVVIHKLRQKLVRHHFENWLEDVEKQTTYRSGGIRFNPN